MTRMFSAIAIVTLAALSGASQAAGNHAAAPSVSAPKPAEFTDGEVRKIDLEAGKVTIKHDEIKNLEMPAMTMVFYVKDKSMLNGLNVGDKIKFKVIQDGVLFMVMELKVRP